MIILRKQSLGQNADVAVIRMHTQKSVVVTIFHKFWLFAKANLVYLHDAPQGTKIILILLLEKLYLFPNCKWFYQIFASCEGETRERVPLVIKTLPWS